MSNWFIEVKKIKKDDYDKLKKKEGLSVISIRKKLYCNKCGMQVINIIAWKEIHLDFHMNLDNKYYG